MIEMSATIRNTNGIHCRPSAVIAKEAMGYRGEIKIVTDAGVCDPRSVMALITMGLAEGSTIKIRVAGPDEKSMCKKFVKLFERHFDFPPRDPNEEPIPARVASNGPRAQFEAG